MSVPNLKNHTKPVSSYDLDKMYVGQTDWHVQSNIFPLLKSGSILTNISMILMSHRYPQHRISYTFLAIFYYPYRGDIVLAFPPTALIFIWLWPEHNFYIMDGFQYNLVQLFSIISRCAISNIWSSTFGQISTRQRSHFKVNVKIGID